MGRSIAIIGSSCRLPGSASSPAKLWDLLLNPKDLSQEIPIDRFDINSFYHEDAQHHGTTNTKKSYFLQEDPAMFDAQFFEIHPKLAEAMDPQQRILLELVYEAIERSGYSLESLRGQQAGVFVGSMTTDYADLQKRSPQDFPQYMAVGTAQSILSNRISWFFDLKGPSITIDTACSSSLVAIHLAVQSLRAEESVLAIVAGVNLIFGPELYISESNLSMLSPSGHCKMWDESADGYARGEGGNVLILKLLDDAIKDGDKIDCIIRETGVNSDGKTSGITLPSAESQAALIQQTFTKAGLDPHCPLQRCQYFEAHGTGTKAGDPIEAEAISRAFFPQNLEQGCRGDSIMVGSIKTVIGHTEGAAGIAGIMKASLAMKHRTIPPNLHFQTISKEVKPFASNLRVVTAAETWPEVPKFSPLRACVNSFGFGGTNAHVILESFDLRAFQSLSPKPKALPEQPILPLVLSATSHYSLIKLAQRMLHFLDDLKPSETNEFLLHLQNRSALPIRQAFSASNLTMLKLEIRKFIDIETNDSCTVLASRLSKPDHATKMLGIFTGQGAQWPNMGAHLIRSYPVFDRCIRKLDEALRNMQEAPDWSIENELCSPISDSRVHKPEVSQTLCTAVQIGLIQLLECAGVRFDIVVGHSSGEIAAAYYTGFISDVDAIRVAYLRGLATKVAPPDCGMMAVGLGYEEAQHLCTQPPFKNSLTVAASNSPSLTTLSGKLSTLKELKIELDKRNTFARHLMIPVAYHSPHMLKVGDQYLAYLENCNITYRKQQDSPIWISTVRGYVSGTALSSINNKYWYDNLTNTVQFYEALQQIKMIHGPIKFCLEVGPHPALKGPTIQSLRSQDDTEIVQYVETLRRDHEDVSMFSQALGKIWSGFRQHSVNFRALIMDNYPGSCTHPSNIRDIPSYQWDHSRAFWNESRSSRDFRIHSTVPHPLLGKLYRKHGGIYQWKNSLHQNQVPWIEGHKIQGSIVVPAAAFCTMALDAVQMVVSGVSINALEIIDFEIEHPLVIERENNGIAVEFLLQRSSKIDLLTNFARKPEAFSFCGSAYLGGSFCEIFKGSLRVLEGQPSSDVLPPRRKFRPDMNSVNMTEFYSALQSIGLTFTGSFQGLVDGTRRHLEATCTSFTPKSEQFMHPAFLDSCFQSVYLAFSAPKDGNIWAPFLPQKINRLLLKTSHWQEITTESTKFEIDSFVTEYRLPGWNSRASILGDVELYSKDKPLLLVEGISFSPLTVDDAGIDRDVVLYTDWASDVSITSMSEVESQEAGPGDIEMAMVCERIACYYYRLLIHQLGDSVHTGSYESLVAHSRQLVSDIQNDKLISARSEWLHDNSTQIGILLDQYSNSIDVKLIRLIGDNLLSIVKGEMNVMELVFSDSSAPLIEQFYVSGLGLQSCNQYLAQAVKQISHRYPRMNILEIGAGTGSTTRSVLTSLGNAFESYTFTDISSGFFEKMQANNFPWESKVKYKTLDLEHDTLKQGFQLESFQVIIASLVLHATGSLHHTLLNVRKLLMPGGFLCFTELAGPTVRLGLMFGGFPGWWKGKEDGRERSPAAPLERWDYELKRAGFTGLGQVVHDFRTNSIQACAFMITQATNERFEKIRRPLLHQNTFSPIGSLLILSDDLKLSSEITTHLSIWKDKITYKRSLDDIDEHLVREHPTLISLLDTQHPILQEMSPTEFKALQYIFQHCKNILWVTSGTDSQSPYASMMLGLGRVIASETPQLTLQFLDIDNMTQSASSFVAEALLRLIKETNSDNEEPIVWTTETEIRLRNSQTLIPRILPIPEVNKRFNARRRLVRMDLKDQELYERNHTGVYSSTSCMTVSVRILNYSQDALRTPLGPFFYIFTGFINDTKTPCCGISPQIEPIVQIPRAWLCLPNGACSNDTITNQHWLDILGGILIAKCIASTGSAGIIVHNASPIMSSIINSEAALTTRTLKFTTTNKHDLGVSTPPIYIHENTPSRLIPQDLLKEVDTVADLTVTGMSHVGRLLSGLSKSVTLYTMTQFIQERATKLDWSSTDTYNNLSSLMIDLEVKIQTYALQMKPELFDFYSAQPYRTKNFSSEESVATMFTRPIDPISLFRKDGCYLLIGLSGLLGQSMCRWMIRNGARHIIFGNRHPVTEPQWQQELEDLGAKIYLWRIDVSNMESLKMAHDRATESNIPPFAGVINGAMVLSDSAFTNVTFKSIDIVTSPKVEGSKNLDRLFYNVKLDFFILFSSIACVIGNRGQSIYSAANMFMNALVAKRRKRGLAATSIDLGRIVGVGYVERAKTEGKMFENIFSEANFMPLSEDDVHNIVAEAILAGRTDSYLPNELITGLEPVREQQNPFWKDNPRFSHHYVTNYSYQFNNTKHHCSDSTKSRLAKANHKQDFQTILESGFLDHLCATLHLAPETVNSSMSLAELGVDSLVAVGLRSWFLREVDFEITLVRLLGGATISDCLYLKFIVVSLAHSTIVCTEISETLCEEKSAESDTTANSNDTLFDSAYDNGRSIANTEKDSDLTDQELEVKCNKPLEIKEESLCGETINSALSTTQRAMWFLTEATQDPTIFNCTGAYYIHGSFNHIAFKNALLATMERNEILRTAFVPSEVDGGLKQVALKSPNLRWLYRYEPEFESENSEFNLVSSYRYNLSAGETMFCSLIRLNSTKHYVVLGFHHLVMDGISFQVLLHDIAKIYSSRDGTNHSISAQYRDFAVEQNCGLQYGSFENEIRYWRNELTVTALPRPIFPCCNVKGLTNSLSVQRSNKSTVLDSQIDRQIQHLCEVIGTTPLRFFAVALQLLIFHHLDITDVCIGIVDSNRRDHKLTKMIGPLANILPVHFQTDPNITLGSMLVKTGDKINEAFRNSLIPLEAIIEDLKHHIGAHFVNPLHIILNFIGQAASGLNMDGAVFKYHRSCDARNQYDLTVTIREDTDGAIAISFSALEGLYNNADIGILLTEYVHVIHTLSYNPVCTLKDLSLSSDILKAQETSIAMSVYEPLRNVEYNTILEKIFKVFNESPNCLALLDDFGNSLTYSEVEVRVNSLGVRLAHLQITKGSVVAVLQKPSVELVCSLLAIWSLGAIYLPLDPQYPANRIHRILKESNTSLVLVNSNLPTTHDSKEDFPPYCDVARISRTATPQDKIIPDKKWVAMVIYTSGTTGAPKGIALTHANILAHICAVHQKYPLQQPIVLQQSSPGFDASLFEIMISLYSEGLLIITSRQRDPEHIVDLIKTHKVTVTMATPTEYLTWFDYDSQSLKQCLNWHYAFCGGERITSGVLQRFNMLEVNGPRLVNSYGPAECTIACHMTEVAYRSTNDGVWDVASIGTPIPGYYTSLIDDSGTAVPVGQVGEICVSGTGVVQGYHNNGAEANDSFWPKVYDQQDLLLVGHKNIYRTKDKGIRHANGSIGFLGRIDGDSQVKIRGMRVELSEVADIIISSSKGVITDCSIIVKGEQDLYLVGYVVLEQGRSLKKSLGIERDFLDSLPLPGYMRPVSLHPLKTLPITPNGKLDKSALEQLSLDEHNVLHGVDELSTAEKRLAELWIEFLPKSGSLIQKTTNFFSIGGTSIILLRLRAALSRITEMPIPLMLLFENPNLAQMARQIEDIITSRHKIEVKPLVGRPNWASEVTVSDIPMPINQKSDKPEWPPQVVVLTGSTGFLGRHLLSALTNSPDIDTIHCVAVRPQVGDSHSRTLNIDSPKIVMHYGNLEDQFLGLSSDKFELLASTADVVIHNGAAVSFLQTYDTLRGPNVQSTKELINLCQPRSIPFFFISSASIMRLTRQNNYPADSVSQFFPNERTDGYTASKWVSEVLLENASKIFKIPITIFRPTSITGEDAPVHDIIHNILKFSRRIGAVPELPRRLGYFDLVSVERVTSDIIDKLKLSKAPERGIVSYIHLSSRADSCFPVSQLGYYLSHTGKVHMDTIHLDQWLLAAKTYGMDELIILFMSNLDRWGADNYSILLPKIKSSS